MYVCICARVREKDVRKAIRKGALSEDAVARVCGAGAGCGACLDLIQDLIEESR